MGHPTPRTAFNDPKNCVLVVPVVGRQGMTFQETIVRQPVRLGGSCGPYCRRRGAIRHLAGMRGNQIE